MSARILLSAAACGAAFALAACQTERKVPDTPTTAAAPEVGAAAQCDLNNPAPRAPAAHDAHPLHNVHRINDKIISGAVPEGDAGFDALKTLGVRTIISVDGATPEVDRAQQRGMRYVHIPTTYAEVTEPQRAEIARALRDLPGPIYVHCHHGKHRSPAAVAAAAVGLGLITPDEGIAFMTRAGTAPNYQGLYACVREATVLDAAQIDAAPADFPAVRRPKGIVAAMVEIDQVYDNLGHIKSAGWKTPGDHPDLVPAAEAARLADHFRTSAEDPKARAAGEDLLRRLDAAVRSATRLEDALAASAPLAQLDTAWSAVVSSCKSCHAAHRDQRSR